ATCRGQCLTVRGKGEANDVLFVPLPKCPARDHVPQLESIVELGDDRLAIVRKREIQRSLVSPLTVPILEFAQQFPRRCFQEIETAYLSTTGSQDTPIWGQRGAQDLKIAAVEDLRFGDGVELAQQLAGGHVPQLGQVVSPGRDEFFAVRREAQAAEPQVAPQTHGAPTSQRATRQGADITI